MFARPQDPVAVAVLALVEVVPFKRCSCGATFTPEQWKQLPFVGTQECLDLVLDLRNCGCGSTLGVPVAESIPRCPNCGSELIPTGDGSKCEHGCELCQPYIVDGDPDEESIGCCDVPADYDAETPEAA